MWASKKQEAWGNTPAGKKALGPKTVAEFNAASKGKKLPEVSKKKPKPKPVSPAKASVPPRRTNPFV